MNALQLSELPHVSELFLSWTLFLSLQTSEEVGCLLDGDFSRFVLLRVAFWELEGGGDSELAVFIFKLDVKVRAPDRHSNLSRDAFEREDGAVVAFWEDTLHQSVCVCVTLATPLRRELPEEELPVW